MLSGSVVTYYSMEQSQGVDGGAGLQVWRVTMNILNMQSQTMNRGGPSTSMLQNIMQGPVVDLLPWY